MKASNFQMQKKRLTLFLMFAAIATLATGCEFGSNIAFQSDAPTTAPIKPTPTPVPTPTPFSQNFDFNNSALYTYDATKIDFANGVAELTASNQNDNSNIALGFAGGTSSGTSWDSITHPTTPFLRLAHLGAVNNSVLDATWAPEWASIVDYFPMDGMVGTIANGATVPATIGNNATSTSTGGPAMTYAGGKVFQAATFDGNYNSLNFQGVALTQLTISAWIYKTAAGAYPSIMESQCINFWIDGASETLKFDAYWQGGSMGRWATTSTIPLNQWIHVAVTYDMSSDANVPILYINGIPQAITAQYSPIYGGTPPTNAATNYIGNATTASGSNGAFTGKIDEFVIWNKMLTTSEINVIYNRQTTQHIGTFTSRVMDGLSTSANWTSLSWIPTLPFFKELPDAPVPSGTATPSPVSETASNYASQTPNLMTGNIGLWHLDEPSTATSVIDASQNGNTGTIHSATLGAPGKLGGAASFDGSSSYISVLDSTLLQAATAQGLTISAWVYRNPEDSNGGVVRGILSKYTTGAAGYFLRVYQGLVNFSQDGNYVVGNTTVTSGTWHHLLGVWDSSTNVRSIYIDGVLDASQTASAPIVPGIGNPLYIGLDYTSGSGRNWNGLIDEVGVWTRALSQAEIVELYRRGANRIKYQVRSCTAVDCSDDASGANWKGPDNSTQSFFSELNNNAIQKDGGDLTTSDSVSANLPSMSFANFTGLAIPTKRYFQYRAIMESDDTSTNCNYGGVSTWCSPEIASVSAGPGHYDTSAPTVTNKTALSYGALSSLIETFGTSACSSGTLYNLSPDNVNWYYWTGAAFGSADGTVAKANSASTITSNLAAFSKQFPKSSLYFKVFLQSSNSSACAIDNLSISGTQ